MKRAKSTKMFLPFESEHSSVAVWPAGTPFPMEIGADGDAHFEMEQRGAWGQISKITGLAISQEFPEHRGTERTEAESGLTVYGVRTMSNPRESGYEMEGYVSLNGKRYSAFTTSHQFRIKGELVDVACLHVRKKER